MKKTFPRLISTLYLTVFFCFLIPWGLYFMEYPDLPSLTDPRPQDIFVGTYTPWGFGHWKYNPIVLSVSVIFFVSIIALISAVFLFFQKNFSKGKYFLVLFFVSMIFFLTIGTTIFWLVDGTY